MESLANRQVAENFLNELAEINSNIVSLTESADDIKDKIAESNLYLKSIATSLIKVCEIKKEKSKYTGGINKA